ncbi:hypothetical protein HDV00_002710 [Rhizophlyctis rosea]|nr:hypothetical protein HDV00_002710 [Rhizophlyctis rosea]
MPALSRTLSSSSLSSVSSISPSPSPPPESQPPATTDLPEVTPKSTTFRGRLGYACLNTILRAQKPSIFSSRTCRIATLEEKGVDYAHSLGLQNAADILPMLEWNEAHDIRFMRLSSEMFPFASHEVWGYKLKDIEGVPEILKKAGDRAKELGHRLTTHPGQYCQIGSKNPDVVRRAILDLEYHADMLDLMGLDQDSVMIIHGGGVYGDRPSTVARFIENWKKVPAHVQKRIVLENDEMCWSVQDLLPICQELKIPLVLDWHHAAILESEHPSTYYVPLIDAIWKERGIKPKQHYSESRPGAVTPMERRAHSDRVVNLPPCLDDMDLMIEAKDKEQAVLELFRMYGLSETWRGSLIEHSGEEGLRTKGRKRRKVEAEVECCEEDEDEETGKKKRRTRKKKVAVEVEEEIVEGKVDECDDGMEVEPVKKKRKSKKKEVVKQETDVVAVVTDGKGKAKKGRAKKVVLQKETEEPVPVEGDVLDAEEVAGGKKKRRKVKVEVVDVAVEGGAEDGQQAVRDGGVLDLSSSAKPKRRKTKKVAEAREGSAEGGGNAPAIATTAIATPPTPEPTPKRSSRKAKGLSAV